MNATSRNSIENIASDLVRRGLPIDYAHRAAAEIVDHHRDLIDELQTTGMNVPKAETEASRRLGDLRTLVKETVREYQRRYWCARWPLLTFLLGPVALVIVTWVISCMAVFVIGWLLEGLSIVGPSQPDGILSVSEWLFLRGSQVWFLMAMPAAVLFRLYRLAARAALTRGWVIVSAVVLALFCGLFLCEFAGNTAKFTLPGDQSLLMVGVPFIDYWRATGKWYAQNPWQVAQVLLPLAIAALLLVWNRVDLIRNQRMLSERNRQGGHHEYAKCA